MKLKFPIKLLSTFILLQLTVSLHALETTLLSLSPNLNLYSTIGIEIPNGEAFERVYDAPEDENRKISELIWKIKNVPMLALDFQADYLQSWRFNMGGKFAISGGNGKMTDSDWLLDSNPSLRTDFSESRVDATNSYSFDLNANYTPYHFHNQRCSLRAGFGYKQIIWTWKEQLISSLYSSDPDNGQINDIVDRLPVGIQGIDYKQTYKIPYLSFEVEIPQKTWSLETKIKYSPFVYAQDRDFHILREILFEEKAKNGKYLNIGTRINYAISPSWAVGFSYTYEQIFEMRANTTLTETGTSYDQLTDNYTTTIKNGASLGFKTHSIGFTISKKL